MGRALTSAEAVFGVSDFVALLNQTLEYAFPSVVIKGELANLKVSKNKWVYFDLKDETSIVHFFGTVFQLPGPLEDGMMLLVRGAPRHHPRFGFSLSVQNIRPAGTGSIRQLAELLKAKLAAEGLFDELRKRPLPYPPARIGLITSRESAAYADFIKILDARWGGIEITAIDVQVQGEIAPAQVSRAIEQFNRSAVPPDVLVVIRGGGSAEDLYAFNTEQVARAVASSRVPTLVAIGHEIDTCLAELAADRRASTPSNAAELLVPDRVETLRQLAAASKQLRASLSDQVRVISSRLSQANEAFIRILTGRLAAAELQIQASRHLLAALNPRTIMGRGYAIVRKRGQGIVVHKSDVRRGDLINVELYDGDFYAAVE